MAHPSGTAARRLQKRQRGAHSGAGQGSPKGLNILLGLNLCIVAENFIWIVSKPGQYYLIVDYHTGGADRFNSPQIRIVPDNESLDELAQIFGAPFVLYSKNLNKS